MSSAIPASLLVGTPSTCPSNGTVLWHTYLTSGNIPSLGNADFNFVNSFQGLADGGTVAVVTSVGSDYVQGITTVVRLDANGGVVSGTDTADAALGAASVTLSASNGAGRSTSTRTFMVVAAPMGKTSDVFATVTGLKVIRPAGNGTTSKYVFKGSVTLSNAGKKPAVGLYLSNSPDFSFPAVASDPSLSQVAVFLDTSNSLSPKLALTPAGGTALTAVLPVTLAKKGDPFSTLGPVPFKLKIAAKRVNTASASYRYLLVVIDPANELKESNKANNITPIDLQQAQ